MSQPLVDVLIPTCGRPTGLAVVLTSLLGQTFHDFAVVVSSQSESPDDLDGPEIQTLIRALGWHGHRVELHHHLPRRGVAEHRQFLLERSHASYVHFLDDDVLLDPLVMERMLEVIQHEGCGFVGAPATGLQFLGDERPDEQGCFDPWAGPVEPEPFTPDALPWERHRVNNAATPLHLEERSCSHGEVVRYKIAWVGGANVLYDRRKLVDAGGFSWWNQLPPNHAGEEALAQFLLIRRWGGCGILPSGTYHLGLPTTVPDRSHNATELFARLIERFAPSPESGDERGPAPASESGEATPAPAPSSRAVIPGEASPNHESPCQHRPGLNPRRQGTDNDAPLRGSGRQSRREYGASKRLAMIQRRRLGRRETRTDFHSI